MAVSSRLSRSPAQSESAGVACSMARRRRDAQEEWADVSAASASGLERELDTAERDVIAVEKLGMLLLDPVDQNGVRLGTHGGQVVDLGLAIRPEQASMVARGADVVDLDVVAA